MGIQIAATNLFQNDCLAFRIQAECLPVFDFRFLKLKNYRSGDRDR